MRRREFITLLGGAATTWPFAGWAQQLERTRTIGINAVPNNTEQQEWLAAFKEALGKLGWNAGANMRIEYRSSAGDTTLTSYAAETAALSPDVIFAQGTPVTAALQR